MKIQRPTYALWCPEDGRCGGGWDPTSCSLLAHLKGNC